MIYINNSNAIMFSHITVPGNPSVDPKFTAAHPHRATVCEIVSVENGEVVQKLAEATAHCNPLDNYSKELGRKRSLTLALKNSNFGKAGRALIWQAYHNRNVRA
jgi:hypothetical protein